MKKVLLILTAVMVLSACGNYKPTRYEDATNQEMQDFHKWEAKQDQKTWENKRANR